MFIIHCLHLGLGAFCFLWYSDSGMIVPSRSPVTLSGALADLTWAGTTFLRGRHGSSITVACEQCDKASRYIFLYRCVSCLAVLIDRTLVECACGLPAGCGSLGPILFIPTRIYTRPYYIFSVSAFKVELIAAKIGQCIWILVDIGVSREISVLVKIIYLKSLRVIGMCGYIYIM